MYFFQTTELSRTKEKILQFFQNIFLTGGFKENDHFYQKGYKEKNI